jgi:hypothetical protein
MVGLPPSFNQHSDSIQKNLIHGTRCPPFREKTSVRIEVLDAFGQKHTNDFALPILKFENALEFNPMFGQTQSSFISDLISHKDDGSFEFTE